MKIFDIFDRKIGYKVNVNDKTCYGRFYYENKFYNGILKNIHPPMCYYICLDGQIVGTPITIIIINKCKKFNI